MGGFGGISPGRARIFSSLRALPADAVSMNRLSAALSRLASALLRVAAGSSLL